MYKKYKVGLIMQIRPGNMPPETGVITYINIGGVYLTGESIGGCLLDASDIRHFESEIITDIFVGAK